MRFSLLIYVLFALLCIALPASIAFFGQSSTATDELNVEIEAITEKYRRLTSAQLKEIDAQNEPIQKQIAAVEKSLSAQQQIYLNGKEAAFKMHNDISADFKRQLEERERDLDSFINALQAIQNKPAQMKKKLADSPLYGEILAKQEQQAAAAREIELAERANVDAAKTAITNLVSLNNQIADEQLKAGTDTDSKTLTELLAKRDKEAEKAQDLFGSISTRNLLGLESFTGLTNIKRKLGSDFISAVTGKPTTLTLGLSEGTKKVMDTLTAWSKGIDFWLTLDHAVKVNAKVEELIQNRKEKAANLGF